MISRRYALAAGSALMTLAAGRTVAQPIEKNNAMQIRRTGSQPSVKGPADYFIGTVRVDPMFPATAPSRVSGRPCDLRAGQPLQLAHTSARPDIDHHIGARLGAA